MLLPKRVAERSPFLIDATAELVPFFFERLDLLIEVLALRPCASTKA